MRSIFRSLFPFFLPVVFLLTSTVEARAQTFVVDTILYNGSADKLINLVFMSDGFQAAELSDYKTKAQNFSNYLFSVSPFLEYKNYFNVFAIRIPSAQSGANHPATASDEGTSGGQPPLSITTYFNSTFDYASIHRLLVPLNTSAINTVLVNNFPLYDLRIMLVNSPYYGGSGGSVATTSVHTSSYEIAAHEIGHSFASLADEYWAGDIYATEKPNMTANNNPATIKWKNWIGTNGISIFPYGATGNPANWFRPHPSCKMQFLGSPFCSVCKETIIEKIHNLLPALDTYQPLNQGYVSYCTQPLKFKLTLIKPNPNTLRVRWILNGTMIGTNVDSVIVSIGQLNAGLNTLSAQVLDTTLLTRSDLHPVNHSYVVNWIISTDPVYDWTGTVNTAWENPANWSCGIVPHSNADVIINAGVSRYPEVNSNVSCKSLTIKPGATVIVKTGYRINITGIGQ